MMWRAGLVAFLAIESAAIAQPLPTPPSCTFTLPSAGGAPAGTPAIRVTVISFSAAPVPTNHYSLAFVCTPPRCTISDTFTYASLAQDWSVGLQTSTGADLYSASGSAGLTPYTYPCDWISNTDPRCRVPVGYVAPTTVTSVRSIDVSSLTASGPLFFTLTTTTHSPVVNVHHVTELGVATDRTACAGFVGPGYPGVIAVVEIVPPQRDVFNVMATNLTNGATETKELTDPVTATIPLGARFELSLQRTSAGQSQVITSNFDLAGTTLQVALVDPTLYPQDALVEFDRGSSADSKKFQAIHLGSERVVITPDDNSLPVQVLTVNVVRPASLGTRYGVISDAGASYDLDAQIVTWADHRGIPPQVIKGIMQSETLPAFDPGTWRYEGNNELAVPLYGALYAPYRMEYDSTHRRGSLLVDSEDVHPRSRFFLSQCVHGAAKIDDRHQDVSAYTIYAANDCWQNWFDNLAPGPKKTRIQIDPAQELDWSAQTTLASSYGLMQVLFEASFTPSYVGIRGQRRPFFLFDLPPNIQAGGGSVPAGTAIFVEKFRRANQVGFSPAFSTDAEFDEALKKALSAYNGVRRIGGITPYGRTAFANSANYPPVPATAIFP
jgi:hypothetical protein